MRSFTEYLEEALVNEAGSLDTKVRQLKDWLVKAGRKTKNGTKEKEGVEYDPSKNTISMDGKVIAVLTDDGKVEDGDMKMVKDAWMKVKQGVKR